MEISVFLKAFGVGLAVAAPVGPMSLLCMRTALTRGWRQGLAVGGGVAVGDALFAAVAALGLAGFSALMLAYEQQMHVAAGLFLIFLGLKTFRSNGGAHETAAAAARGWRRDFAASVLLTLTNPPTIIMFAAVFTALAPKEGFDLTGATITVAGVFIGSMLWWCFVVVAVACLRRAIGRRAQRLIDRFSGAVLAGLGLNELNRGLHFIR